MAQAIKSRFRREPNGPAYIRLRTELAAARKSAGMTQQALAERIGRPQSFVAKVERGERSLDFVEVTFIARILNIDVAELARAVQRTL